MDIVQTLQAAQHQVTPLIQFAVAIAIILYIPSLARVARLPSMIFLVLFGVLVGPHALGFVHERHPVANFVSEIGSILLMFTAGLELDIAQFRRTKFRSFSFGIVAAIIPLALGILTGITFGFSWLTSIVMGAIFASHTLITLPILTSLGVLRHEPVVVGIGATAVSDTLALIIFGVCVTTFTSGFSISKISIQLGTFAIVVPLILIVPTTIGGALLRRMESARAEFLLMLCIMVASAALAQLVGLADIVGAFLAGLSVNTLYKSREAKHRLDFFGDALFIPGFFVVTGMMIDPGAFADSIWNHSLLVLCFVLSPLIGKGLSAWSLGGLYGYSVPGRMVLWGISVPQVAATLAVTVVAYGTHDTAGNRLISEPIFNAVFVLIVLSSVFGSMLVQRFGPRL